MDAPPPPSDPSPWLPFESRRRARDEKREAVLRAAVRLFLEQGYHRATLNEVAERLNITKPALYNYFRGKDEILFECWAMGQERVDDFIAGINADGGTGLAKLRKLIRRLCAKSWRPISAPAWCGSTCAISAKRIRSRSRRQAEHRPHLSQIYHRGHLRRLDQAVRSQAGGLCDRRIAELDRPLVPIRRPIVAECHCGRIHHRLTEGLARRPAGGKPRARSSR